MAIITDVKPYKTKLRQNVYIDDDFYGAVATETTLANGIEKGVEIDLETFDFMVKESDKNLALAYLYNYLQCYSVTEKKAKDKLRERGHFADVIEECMAYVKDKGYINDFRFAENFLESNKSTKGYGKIKMELFAKGVSSEIIKEVMENFDTETELEIAFDKAGKWWINKDINDRLEKQRFIRFMASRGFNWGVIQSCLKKVEDSCLED